MADRASDTSVLAGMRVAVIIPYFQRKPGLLSEAVESVFKQSLLSQGATLVLSIVDDHSPRPPALDLQDLVVPERVELHIDKTPINGGPAAARNLGLDALGADIDFVAFLDSDEVWAPGHLENALLTLQQSETAIYFANYTRAEWTQDKFTIIGLDEGHAPVCPDRRSYRFVGDPLIDVLIKATVRIQTCVVRWSALRSFRFREGLAIGEDADYVAQAVTSASLALSFSMNVETLAERAGVNVSQNIDKDPAKERKIRLEMLRYQRHVLDSYGDDVHFREAAREALMEARYNYMKAVQSHSPHVLALLSGLFLGCREDRGFGGWCARAAVSKGRGLLGLG